MELKKFIDAFPAGQTEPVDEKIVSKYSIILPTALIELWKKHGFGKYGDGFIELINPDDFETTLQTWLGKKSDNYVPIAISAFGNLFYYRKLTAADEDVCLIDPQYRKIHNCSWNLVDFFNEYLTDDTIRKEALREELFKNATDYFGLLEKNEIYIFSLAFALGGMDHIDNINKGNAQVQLELLFQIGA